MSAYANINNFGSTCNTPGGNDDPLSYCLVNTTDKNFQHGSIGHLFGPRSQKCQTYMAQRCAENWDGFCEYYYRANQPSSDQWPNQRAWPNTDQLRAWDRLGRPTLSNGNQLLQNAGERRFCTYLNCKPRCELFDPTNPSSPTITYYDNTSLSSCVPVCDQIPDNIDQDPVMNRMLANPQAAAPTLINICNTARRTGRDLSGTKIGKFCKRYHQNMNMISKI